MVWSTCNITFHNGTNGTFYTSDVVTGIITLDIKKKSKINRKYSLILLINFNVLLFRSLCF